MAEEMEIILWEYQSSDFWIGTSYVRAKGTVDICVKDHSAR